MSFLFLHKDEEDLKNGTLKNGTLKNGTLKNGTLKNGALKKWNPHRWDLLQKKKVLKSSTFNFFISFGYSDFRLG